MDEERLNQLYNRKEILGAELLGQIDSFTSFCRKTAPQVKVISGEEKLKSRAMELLPGQEVVSKEFFCTANQTVDRSALLLSDFLVIYTSAMKLAPLSLTQALEGLRFLNKRTYILVDKWNLLPITQENIAIVQKNAHEQFSMCNITKVIMLGGHAKDRFTAFDQVNNVVTADITTIYQETHNMQAEKLYSFYLKVLNQEYHDFSVNAQEEVGLIEELKQNVRSLHQGARIKYKNLSAGICLISQGFMDKVKRIGFYEIAEAGNITKDGDLTEIKEKFTSGYLKLIMSCYQDLTAMSVNSFRADTLKFTENCVRDCAQIALSLERLRLKDTSILQEFKEASSHMDIIGKASEQIRRVLDTSFDILGNRLRGMLKKIIYEEFIPVERKASHSAFYQKLKENLSIDSSAYEEYDNPDNGGYDESCETEYACNEEPDNDSLWNTLEQAGKRITERTNIELFAEMDIFLSMSRKDIVSISENIVDAHYIKLEKLLIRLEESLEQKYIVR